MSKSFYKILALSLLGSGGGGGKGTKILPYDPTKAYAVNDLFLYENRYGITTVAHDAEEFNSAHNILTAQKEEIDVIMSNITELTGNVATLRDDVDTAESNITTLSNGLQEAEQKIQELDSDITNISEDVADVETEVADIKDLIPSEATAQNQLADKAYVTAATNNVVVIESTGYIGVGDTNSTAVPVLTVEQVTEAYNAIAQKKTVYIKDMMGTNEILVLQKAPPDGNVAIYFDYLGRLSLAYTVHGDLVDIAFTEGFTRSYLDTVYAPLTFVSNLYGALNTGNIINLRDAAPVADPNNILQLSGGTNTDYDWNNPSVVFVRKIEVDTTLSKANSLTFTLKYKVSRPVTLSWGAKIQYSTDNINWEDLSGNQSYNAVPISSIDGGVSTDITVFTDAIIGTKRIPKDGYLRVLLFKKAADSAPLDVNLYFGVNVDNAYVCTFAQFNFTNVNINTEQIEDGSITKAKLSNALATEIDGKQDALDPSQILVLNSGITADKVSAYDSHLENTSNPHSVTKTQVGLGNVDNTSDMNKPISTATQAALDAKQASLVSGSNIKTLNGQNILGSGDLSFAVATIGYEEVE